MSSVQNTSPKTGAANDSATVYSVELSEEQKRFIKDATSSAEYKDHPVSQDIIDEFEPNLEGFAFITPVSSSNLTSFYPEPSRAHDFLQADWEFALSIKAFYVRMDGKINFPTRMRLKNGCIAEISIAKNNRSHDGVGKWKPWVVVYVPNPSQLAKDNSECDGVPAVQAEAPIEPMPEILEAKLLAMRFTKDYLQYRVPEDLLEELDSFDGPLSSFAFLPWEMRARIVELAGYNFDVAAMLDRDFRTDAKNGALRCYDGKILFPISILRSDDSTPVEVTIRRQFGSGGDAAGMLPWRVHYVDDYVREAAQARFAFENWATITSWEGMLRTLAETALPEMWDFEEETGPERRRYSILKGYLKYTFYHLQVESLKGKKNKICENAELDIAAFNTGLVNEVYEPLYACFSKKNGVDKPWVFDGFCQAGSRMLGKKLVRAFNPLPERAQYFTKKEDLLFDTAQPLELDTNHILLDNISRLPLDFLEDELDSNKDSRAIIADLRQCEDNGERAKLFGNLRMVVEDNPRLLRRMMHRLDDAKDLALKRVEWNFRTAVPAFYPRRNTMSLLLPLDLTEDDAPDIALVVEPTESGAYLGQTILTMRMAYNNARLVCRPDSDWLNTSVNIAIGEDQDDEEEEW